MRGTCVGAQAQRWPARHSCGSSNEVARRQKLGETHGAQPVESHGSLGAPSMILPSLRIGNTNYNLYLFFGRSPA